MSGGKRVRAGYVVAILALATNAASAAAEDFAVREKEIEDRKAVVATVESVDRIAARARIGGTIAKLVVDEGASVRRGDVLAEVVDPKLDSRRQAVEARIQALESQKKLAQTVLDRVAKLRETGAAAQARLDEAITGLRVVDRDLVAMIAERKVILQQQAEGAVLAPAGGRVLAVPVTGGAVVLPGETVAVIAATGYILRLHLPERHARFLRVGDRVQVGAAALEAAERTDKLRTGRIVQVYPALRQGRVVADVDVEGLGDYFVGERVAVHVATGKRRTFVVPPEYLFRRYGLTLAKLKDGREVVVQPGLPADGGVEVLSGLADGDVLAKPGVGP
ncbi:MAG: HlyD family efflux transporter periplasmic adaptor subunit [Rhodospirillales bacterium]|nr:HlyD family efflux transporter periplasmic adaptor subunit [Rhodospirillales bacterium]